MIIVDLDFDQRIEKLKKDINNVKKLKNSLSESRKEYRTFSDEIGLDFEVLDSCFANFEKTVLIDAYTLAEQLVKNSYYYLLFTTVENEYVRTFIDNKIPKKTFSPNVRYGKMQESLQKELIPDFSFIIKNDNDFIKSYEILIDERHQYAHTGNYGFEFEKIDEVVFAIEYFYKEFETIIQHDNDYRKQFQEELRELIGAIKNVKSVEKNYQPSSEKSKSAVTERLECLQTKIEIFYDSYYAEMSLSIFSELNEKAREFVQLDIRKDINNTIKKYNILFDEMTKLKFA